MTLNDIKKALLKIPGAQLVRKKLLAQGHTELEADGAGVATAVLLLFFAILFLNSFVLGVIRTFFNDLWALCLANTVEATGVGIFGTLIFLALIFQFLNRSSAKKAERNYRDRQEQHQLHEKRQYLNKGAMGHFEELFRGLLAEKYPSLEIRSVHVVGTIPRIRFKAQRFSMDSSGKVEKNYQLFRDTLLSDTLLLIETAMDLSENIPAVIVDAMMGFINRGAKYYDGAVLSVKATREVFRKLDRQSANTFRSLSAFDLRYRDGMEVEAVPEEEDKTARVLERIRESGPRVEVRYGSAKQKGEEGWEKPRAPEAAVPLGNAHPSQGMSSMSLAQFQDLVVGVLSKLSFDVQKVKKVPGGTLQILADYDHPIIGGRFMVLARQYPEGAEVHADLVRELDEITREEACKRGIYMITGKFAEEARNVSRGMAVDLVDGKVLSGLLDGPAYDGRWNIQAADEKGVLTDLSQMPLLGFEQEVDQFLKNLGFRVVKIRRAPGGAIVAVVEHAHPVTGGKFAVLAKQFPLETQVPAEQVSEFARIMQAEFCNRGILMATAGFSVEARTLSRISRVELVDRNGWENLRRKMGGGA